MRHVIYGLLALGFTLFGFGSSSATSSETPPPVRVLFLGDSGHHQPRPRYDQIVEPFAHRNIKLTYTDKLSDLNAEKLANYDVLAIYANHDAIDPAQAQAILDFVASGKGLVPIHCASYCFRNSDDYVKLVGAQFLRHGMELVRTEIQPVKHPILAGFGGFDSWDETYVHTKHNPENRIVLETRREGEAHEPWTWVRTHGKGRVFYTAWGHDERTWGAPGFRNLLERGIRWSAGQDATIAGPWNDRPRLIVPAEGNDKDFAFIPGKLPFYPVSDKWGVQGEPITTMQAPLSPAKSMRHIGVPEGFRLELFASEPQIGGKPIAMNWDERGRLWIAETVDYPNEMQPPGQGRDRIRICEDTDGDGKADKFTVFAEKLSIPTSIAFSRGGVIVHQAPDTIFLKDTDGDDKADQRQVLFAGWGTEDTHAGPSNLNYGLDNWFYGILGYSGFEGTVGGEPMKFRTGFYRFKPDGSKMEFLRNTSNNSWGVGISEEGVLFGSTANDNPSVHMAIPNRFYEQVRGWSSRVLPMISETARMYPITEKVRQVDQHGRFTAGAGHALYTARAYPREYWNRTAFVTEPTGHLAATFVLQPKGATYFSRNSWNLLAGRDEWVAPIMAEVGPDGQVWVIDWYNIIVQHNPTPQGFTTGKGNAYETDLRDKKHARIYRVVYGDGKKPHRKTLAGLGPEGLVEALKDDNFFWRRHAQRLLVERGKTDIVEPLTKLIHDRTTDAVGLNPGAIHALWTLHGLGVLDQPDELAISALAGGLDHPSPGVRKAATDVLPRSGDVGTKLLRNSGGIDDTDMQARLSALLALAEMETSKIVAETLVKAFEKPENVTDPILADALTSALARNETYVLDALANATVSKVNENQTIARERSRILRIFGEHIARGSKPESALPIAQKLAALAPADSESMIEGLVLGWPGSVKPEDSPEIGVALGKLLSSQTQVGQGLVIRLAKLWGNTSLSKQAVKIAEQFLNRARDESADSDARSNAARQWVQLRGNDPKAIATMLELITPRTDPALAEGFVAAVAEANSDQAGQVLLERIGPWTPSTKRAALAIVTSRVAWVKSLIESLEKGEVPLTELALDQRTALAQYPDAQLAARFREILEKGGGLPSADRQKVIEELATVYRNKGDAVAGKTVFQNNCAKCHRHSGEGASVGPDLTGMAVHPKEELAVHILDPSRSVEGNYRAYTVATTDGRVLTGLLSSESRTAIELLDAEAKPIRLPRSEIDEIAASPKSLMPEGFEKTINEKQLTDLLEFLTRKGRWLPLPIEKVATAVSTKGMFHDGDQGPDRIVLNDWSRRDVGGVPFDVVDPRGKSTRNVVLLNGPLGSMPPKMPKSVALPVNAPLKSLHMLSGVSGWGWPASGKGSVSLTVRLTYADGSTEDHKLINGEHFADYIRRVDVPGSQFAFMAGGQQLRRIDLTPKKPDVIKTIELIKGQDQTAPIVLAITAELPGE
jgi:putative membrane-bound dehydrogenase-like protein